MSQLLDNIVNSLLERILIVLDSDDGESCAYYLRSTCKKLLFAEERLKCLVKHIEEYRQKFERREILDRLFIEMDFDHLIQSLRSSLEHLAQSINAVIPLTLANAVTPIRAIINLKSVVVELKRYNQLQENTHLAELCSYLDKRVVEDWYRELHELRVEIFHDKFKRFPRVSTRGFGRQLLDFKFLLTDDTVNMAASDERSLISYCRSTIGKVEDVLRDCFHLLNSYFLKI